MWERCAILLLSALLAGCASMADQLHGTLEPPASTGRAVVSLTAWAFEPDQTIVELEYQGVSNLAKRGVLYASLATDTVFGEQGMSPVEGKLELLTLPPGEYRFTEAIGYTPSEGFPDIGPRIVRLPVNRHFEIKAGETVYLGEVRLDLSFKPELILNNRQQRDFGHIHRVWHVTDTSHIAVRTLAP